MLVLLSIGFYYLMTGGSETSEIERLTSPNRKVNAVLIIRASGGVLGNFSYGLYIVPTGEEKELPRDPLLSADRIREGLDLSWRNDSVLEIQYRGAVIKSFRNRAAVPNEEGGTRYVEVRLLLVDEEASPVVDESNEFQSRRRNLHQ